MFRPVLIAIRFTGHFLCCSILITFLGQSTFLITVLEQQSSKTTHINHCCAPGLSAGAGTSWITFQSSDPFYGWVILLSQLSIRNDANGQFRSRFRLICLDKTKTKPVAPSCVTLCYNAFSNKFKASSLWTNNFDSLTSTQTGYMNTTKQWRCINKKKK
jgi:hypothetical protein